MIELRSRIVVDPRKRAPKRDHWYKVGNVRDFTNAVDIWLIVYVDDIILPYFIRLEHFTSEHDEQ